MSDRETLQVGPVYEVEVDLKGANPDTVRLEALQRELRRQTKRPDLTVLDWGTRDGVAVVQFRLTGAHAQPQGDVAAMVAPVVVVQVAALVAAVGAVIWGLYALTVQVRGVFEIIDEGPLGWGAGTLMVGLGLLLAYPLVSLGLRLLESWRKGSGGG